MTHSLCRSVSRFVADLSPDFINYYFINTYLKIYSLLEIKAYLVTELSKVKLQRSNMMTYQLKGEKCDFSKKPSFKYTTGVYRTKRFC